MDKSEQIAWKWIMRQPALGAFEKQVYPVDTVLSANLSVLYSMLIGVPCLAECIRLRALAYVKAGCRAGVKCAVRDYLEAIR